MDIGVNAERVLTFWVIPSEARVPPATAPAFIARLVDAIGRAPGVDAVTVAFGISYTLACRRPVRIL